MINWFKRKIEALLMSGTVRAAVPEGGKTFRFLLKYEERPIGFLVFEKGFWRFQYDDEFKKKLFIQPLANFPDIHKVYESEELFPFFITRIPTPNQPIRIKKLGEGPKNEDQDLGTLLKLFGRRSLTNPFELIALS